MKRSFFQRRLVDPLIAQLRQGTSPEKLALSCTIGAALGLFPIIGSTTVLCLFAAHILKLNQATTQLANHSMFAFQIPLVPVFVRIGEHIVGAPPVPLMPTKLASQFVAGPGAFMRQYGMAGLHGILAWTLLIPLLAVPLYFVLAVVLKKIRVKTARHFLKS